MMLLNVRRFNFRKGTFIEVQSGDKAWRSPEITKEHDVDFYCTEVILAMLASAASGFNFVPRSIPDLQELKKPLKDGIGLSDDHKQLLLVKDGEVQVLEEGPRWAISNSLKTRVGRAIDEKRHIRGEW